MDSPILISNVRCDPLDTDITKCKLSERRDMFLNTCDHADDVGIRCYDVSWAGIRLGKKINIPGLIIEMNKEKFFYCVNNIFNMKYIYFFKFRNDCEA